MSMWLILAPDTSSRSGDASSVSTLMMQVENPTEGAEQRIKADERMASACLPSAYPFASVAVS
jgi:hypothetical protein